MYFSPAIYTAKAVTPFSLFGIDRRIGYATRKYHSSRMCPGVASGFAGIKLSGSLRMFASFIVNTASIMLATIAQSI